MLNEAEKEYTEKLRPEKFADFIGQERLKEALKNYILFNKEKGRVMDHVLFTGPAGTGKTTLANIMGHEMGVNIYSATGPSLRRIEDVITILEKLSRGDIFFIDEIHKLNDNVEHFLYPIMEDFHYTATIREGGEWKYIDKDIPKFTIIGSTTKPGELEIPFLDRFGLQERIEDYEIDDLILIIFRSAKILEINISRDGALSIAKRSKFIPRKANYLLKRINEYAWNRKEKEITNEIVASGCKMLGIDDLGLEYVDRNYLKYLADNGPAGLKNISIAVEEDQKTIEDLHEPYMIKIKLIKKTPKGRILLGEGFKHLGLKIPEGRYRNEDYL